MKRVCVESPLRGDRELNKLYARVCMLDCLVRGESGYASHLLFDHEDLLDDEVEAERKLGIAAGFAWASQCELRVFYLDLGESDGMKLGREQAIELVQPTEDRRMFFADGLMKQPLVIKRGILRAQGGLLREKLAETLLELFEAKTR